MKRLPKVKSIEITDHQKVWCGLWLEAWDIHKGLGQETQDDDMAPASPEPAHTKLEIAPFADTLPKVGEIRMLAGSLTPESDTPVFVALIGGEEGGLWATPYSRFGAPAFLSELATGWEEEDLAALCIWNSVFLSPESLKSSWLVDTLSPAECEDAMASLQSFLSGEPLPERLRHRVGAPILYPDDPRLLYQEEEILRCAGLRGLAEFSGLEEEDAQKADAVITEEENIIQFPEFQERLLAAASETETLFPVWVYKDSSDTEPVEARVLCDMPFTLYPGSGKLPLAQWVFEDPHPEWSGATALLILKEGQKVIARGKMDEEGEVVDFLEVFPEKITQEITERSALFVALFLGDPGK